MFPAVVPPLCRATPGWQRITTSWEMTLQNSWHSFTGKEGGELFPPKVKHGNDYVHCCWCWVVSLSLSLTETSTQCSLSPRWPFSNVNGWLTVRGHSGRGGGVGGMAIHSRWGRSPSRSLKILHRSKLEAQRRVILHGNVVKMLKKRDFTAWKYHNFLNRQWG